jgi:N-acetyl-alpha-D-glucosaminyl L-malate synthase BshA
MKIGITCYPTYGGSGVVATELGIKLAEIGHEVHFISYALPYRLRGFTSNIFFHEVEVVRYPLFEYPPYSLSLATTMAEVIEHQQLDLLHVHYAIPHATSAFLAKQMLGDSSIRIITTLHGTDITLIGSDPSFLPITRFSIDQSNGVTAVSDFLRAETEKVFGITKPIEVIPNFVPFKILERVPDLMVRRRFAQDNELLLTHISNFRPLKRVHEIVEVVKNFKDKHKLKVLMVGDGPERYRVEEECRRENLCDRVIFLGKQEEIQQILSISDIFILPSETESFGLAALEAMAFSVPCITSNAGGLPEVNIHGQTGFTIEVGDIAGYTAALEELVNNDELRLKMGNNAHEVAQGNFSFQRIIPQYVDYYKRILSEG